MCLFACWFWFPFAVWDYTFITVLYRAWKGVCFDSQNEESIISKSWFPHVDNWARGKKSFKASPSNSFFFFVAWAAFFSIRNTSLVSFAGATSAGLWHHKVWWSSSPGPFSMACFFISPWRYILKLHLGQQGPHTRAVLLNSLVQLWGWALRSSLQRGPRSYSKNQIWIALVLLYYAAMNSGLLLFKLPAHQKGWRGAN